MEVLKDLAGAEDLLLDAELPNTVVQSRGGKDYNITKINADTVPYTGTFGQSGMQSIKAKIDNIDNSIENLEYIVDTIEDLATYTGTGLVMVKDIYRGGTFVSKTEVDIDQNTGSLYLANDGTVFAKLGGGFWVRQYSGALDARWFGSVGDGVTDDTASLQSCLNLKGHIFIPKPTNNYNIIGELIVGSDTKLIIESGTIFEMDCSGNNGRGFYFKETVNSGIVGCFTINASASTLGDDGSRNSCIQFGNDYSDPAPSITKNCYVSGSIEINISGSNNVKGVYLSGWVEDTEIDGVYVTGMTNFAITSHWSSNVSSGLPSKTWHSHNITVRNCKVYQKNGYNKPLRGYTFSAAGRVNIQNCIADTVTLSFNPFVGDYGYTYAQNITQEEACNFTFNNIVHKGGEAALSCDANSVGLNGSPVWSGAEHQAYVIVEGFEIDGNNSTTGLLIALTSVDKAIFKGVNLYSNSISQTRECFYIQTSNYLSLSGYFKHNRYVRVRTTKDVLIDGCVITKNVFTPDVTSYSITSEGVDNLVVVNSKIEGSRTGIYSNDNMDKSIQVSNCTFDNIGFSVCSIKYCNKLIITNNVYDTVGTTTTTANIYLIDISTSVSGFIISGNVFGVNNARYLISTGATTSNGSIFGNVFLDLNTTTVNPAAIYLNASASNVKIDTNTNIVASGILLQYS